MQNYHWNAKDYEQHSQAQQKWAKELLGKLHLRGTEDLLDIGCGEGKVTAELAGQVHAGSVLGIDSSETMIALAKERYPAEIYRNLTFQVLDARNLPFRENFDVMFSNAALHWVKDPAPVVVGLSRGLRPGGRILLQMGGRGNASGVLSLLEELLATSEWAQYFEGFDFPYGFCGTEEYETLLQAEGFIVRRVELIPKDMELEGKQGLEGWIRTTWLPYTERLPEEKKGKFIEAIATKYLEKVPPKETGKVSVAMVRLEVEAEKAI